MSKFEERRKARAGWPIRRVALEAEPLTDERIPEDVDARLLMVAALTHAQWDLAGDPPPRYTRGEMPGRVQRPE